MSSISLLDSSLGFSFPIRSHSMLTFKNSDIKNIEFVSGILFPDM
jgi:hypothetical protein